MNRIPALRILLIALAVFLPRLQAEEPGIVVPEGEPLLTLSVPGNQKEQTLSVAVSKALAGEKWGSLGWLGHITTAKATVRRVSIDVFAVTSDSQVKLYASYTDDAELSPERRQAIALDHLERLEKRIVKELNLRLHKGKGDNDTDVAS